MHSSRFYFSIQHIKSACLFAQFSFNIETLGDGRSREERLTEQTAYVTGSILSSVAFLEATINEVYADAADGMLNARKLDAGDVRRLGILWETEAFERRAGILEKLQVALTFADSQAFDAGVAPYQDARLLIKLRNFIVHAKPEWITAGVKKGKVPNLEEQLRLKFKLNPLAPEGSEFFPNKCLGHGGANWAVVSVLKLTDEFFSRMKMIPTYDHVREDLKTS